jgi:carboxymethylenebutenolidase
MLRQLRCRLLSLPVEIHRYDADHAFFNDTRPKVYSKPNAEMAWKRTVQFLHAKLD